ncbi:MAG: protoporphyrinogen oxidase HemJ [Rhodospirillaceae bacterium]|jgi:protoporphyrinogen IX oxidase|nr:protoporphyrinogen oxidase HemJ [Rhodospirillaceae bacterium]MBT4487471.1 protoporphyrinogen oxidase HemJ [Rhodospirillaceae bacterium]MBT5193320.1 protoporphyrinogen oxidase HemJ [Rhodospirillaceae bacterium]MBT5897622.1 protoporphyrinogen oxidase HemJ [Rhodospirillaceae bacterium]MBT6426660.1 protoporphyrinogen oxidase HemJ [Rhodospirillaceae bacterium]
MADFLSEWYDWIKALHIISVIAWMAGMLYLPRLYVYHAEAEVGSELSETLKIMERRLLRAIINPAMMAAFILGLCMVFTPGVIDFGAYWIWIKLFCAFFGLGGMHSYLSRWRKDFEADRNTRSAGFYRKVNEIPTVLMIIIVIMVIVRPF